MQLEEKTVIRSSQQGYIEGKSCLTNLVAFCDVTGWVDARRAVDVVYPDFSKAFDTISHSILVVKLRQCGTDEYTLRWTDNWLAGRAQRAVISGTKPGWRSVTSGVHQRSERQWRCIKKCAQQVEGGDSPPLFCHGESTFEYCVQFCDPQFKKDRNPGRRNPTEGHKDDKVPGASPV